METTLPLPFVVSVASPPGLESNAERLRLATEDKKKDESSRRKLPTTNGLWREELACLGCLFFDVKTNESLKGLASLLAQHGPDFNTFVDVSALDVSALDDSALTVLGLKASDQPDLKQVVVAILNNSASKVFVAPSRLSEFADVDHGDRIAPAFSAEEAFKSATTVNHAGLLLQLGDSASQPENKKALADLCKALPDTTPVFVNAGQGADYEGLVTLCCAVSPIPNQSYGKGEKPATAIPVLPSTALTTDIAEDVPENPEAIRKDPSGRLFVSDLLFKSIKTDRPDGLFPTVVCNESGVALGLAYSSKASVNSALATQKGHYQSRKRGSWLKGEESGHTQDMVRVCLDCDNDTFKFVVRQKGRFCHLKQYGCFGELRDLSRLEQTLVSRKNNPVAGSYTNRLLNDTDLLHKKIMEEAKELCDAEEDVRREAQGKELSLDELHARIREQTASEAADVIYFTLAKAVSAGVSLADIEKNLAAKSLKTTRRKGDAKESKAGEAEAGEGRIVMNRIDVAQTSDADVSRALKRPAQNTAAVTVERATKIIKDVRTSGDAALKAFTFTFDLKGRGEATQPLDHTVDNGPFDQNEKEIKRLEEQIGEKTRKAIDTSFENIWKFHEAQQANGDLQVQTMDGVVCSRFVRPIERVGLYVPGGSAALLSTALMLGVPAKVAKCKGIVLATPPRADGSISPEIVYVAHKIGAHSIVKAGGAQAIAAMAYGTETIPKVDKILGPGNSYVTAAKMIVSNDANAGVSIDMPAGPSEVLVIADSHANPAFVASDLLSQAEHGADSQVILIAVGLDQAALDAIDDEVHRQALALPDRLDLVRKSIGHSTTFCVSDMDKAMELSNQYAPEHLILQVQNAEGLVEKVENAGSVFIGEWTPESVGDYSAGVNHSLPTYGYAKQYSGVNLGSFVKHITSSNLTDQGLVNISEAVMQLAQVEGLGAHRRAVEIRMDRLKETRPELFK